MKRLFISFLSVISALVFLLAVASPAWAASGPTSIDLTDHAIASGTDWHYAAGVFTITGATPITVTGTVSDGTRIVIDDNGGAGITANLTFNGVSITGLGSGQSPLTVSPPSALNLTITNTNTLSAGDGAAGITVESGATLVIDGSGTLAATGGSGSGGDGVGAGIGGGGGISGISGGDGGDGGTVTIEGSANVTAIGGGSTFGSVGGAGIGGGGGAGGGNGGDGGTVTIGGSANVTAIGGSARTGGAGIGGGGSANGSGGGSGVFSTTTTGLVTASGGSGYNDGANIGAGGSMSSTGTDISNTVGCFVVDASVSGGNGSISPLGSWSVNRGDMSFAITADSGYAIDSIMDGLTDVTGAQKGQASGAYALSGIAANHAIVVMFGLKGTPPTSVPTLNAWALALLALLMGGVVVVRRRQA